MGSQEDVIIKKCQAGDWSNFSQLYEVYVRRIYGFIYFKTMHHEVAEDLTSQTFLKVVKKIDSYNSDTSFSAWLFTIARNTVADYYRIEKCHLDIDDFWDMDSGSDLGKEIADRETVLKAKEYLNGLTSSQRELVLMRIWGGMSFKEIAEATGKSESSLKMAFSRIAREMRSDDLLRLVLLGILIR